LVALGDEPGELGFCDHNPEAAPATPTGVKQHAASPRKTSPSMSDFNCRQGGIVIVVAHAEEDGGDLGFFSRKEAQEGRKKEGCGFWPVKRTADARG
jgi:hypothetical protein